MRSVWIVAILVVMRPLCALGQAQPRQPTELFGVWRGTSICTDRVAAPACKDETVVYEFGPGPRPDMAHWKADKIVNGQREAMGEFDLAYDAREGCWLVEFSSPRVRGAWCLTVKGTHISGVLWDLPGKVKVRQIDVDKR